MITHLLSIRAPGKRTEANFFRNRNTEDKGKTTIILAFKAFSQPAHKMLSTEKEKASFQDTVYHSILATPRLERKLSKEISV